MKEDDPPIWSIHLALKIPEAVSQARRRPPRLRTMQLPDGESSKKVYYIQRPSRKGGVPGR